eukprot:312873-Hanusia_phi.AAC.5
MDHEYAAAVESEKSLKAESQYPLAVQQYQSEIANQNEVNDMRKRLQNQPIAPQSSSQPNEELMQSRQRIENVRLLIGLSPSPDHRAGGARDQEPPGDLQPEDS